MLDKTHYQIISVAFSRAVANAFEVQLCPSEEIGYARIRFQLTTMKNVNTNACFVSVEWAFCFLDANICVLASYCYFNYSLFVMMNARQFINVVCWSLLTVNV